VGRGGCLVFRRFQNVHAYDQPALEPIPVADSGVGEKSAGSGVVDHLVDIDHDASIRLFGEALGFYLAGDDAELPAPVVVNSCSANNSTAFPGVGPVDLGVHQLDRGFDIASVEGLIGGPQEQLFLSHVTQPSDGNPLSFGSTSRTSASLRVIRSGCADWDKPTRSARFGESVCVGIAGAKQHRDLPLDVVLHPDHFYLAPVDEQV
jgi:hypothetical protein